MDRFLLPKAGKEREKQEKILFARNDSYLVAYPNWCDAKTCAQLMAKCLKDLPLAHQPRCSLGVQHRDIGFFVLPGDQGPAKGYRYSGQEAKAQAMPEWLQEMTRAVNEALGTKFNGVLVNLYRQGTDYIGAHSDNEKELDASHHAVAGICFGATRTFRIRDKKSRQILLDYPWIPGTLVVMKGDFQQHFTHEIPKQCKVKEMRLSLTWRCHVN